ncbi:MAG: hypothetical protein ACSHXH_17660 [Marivita sp.]|uniref:hypothetical protein n=1 Tax=Marivita sp. TaxID=2003365 RepID=UPI003EF2D28C
MGQKFGLWLEVGTMSRLSYRIKTITNEGQQSILKGRNARLSSRTRMRSEFTLRPHCDASWTAQRTSAIADLLQGLKVCCGLAPPECSFSI